MKEEFADILARIKSGDQCAADELLPLLYTELRLIAKDKLAREKPGQTLQATALVHEAYIRLVGNNDNSMWDGPNHFFSAAAEAMRRILIERAREKSRLKRGGDRERADLVQVEPTVLPVKCDDLLGLDEALSKLEASAPRKAQLVKLRFFAGLTVPEAAKALGISISTAENDWAYARSWLNVEMS